MLTFKQFNETWVTDKPDVRSPEVSGPKTYDDPSKFRTGAKKIGEVGGMHLYASHNPGGGMTHYTWNPADKKIHHVLTNTETTKDADGKSTRLKYLTAHSRKNSPVKMGQVYHNLINNHDRVLVGTSHSHGAVKLWDRLRNNPDIHIHGEHQDGTHQELKPGDPTHAHTTTKDPEQKKIGRMMLVARKRNIGG
jgi:hypothetical protein